MLKFFFIILLFFALLLVIRAIYKILALHKDNNKKKEMLAVVTQHVIGFADLNYKLIFWNALQSSARTSFLHGYKCAYFLFNFLISQISDCNEDEFLLFFLNKLTQVSIDRKNDYEIFLDNKIKNNQEDEPIFLSILAYHVRNSLNKEDLINENKTFATYTNCDKNMGKNSVNLWENYNSEERWAMVCGYFAFLEILDFYLKNQKLLNVLINESEKLLAFQLKSVKKVKSTINKILPKVQINELIQIIDEIYLDTNFVDVSFSYLILQICEAGRSESTESSNIVTIVKELVAFNYKNTDRKVLH